MTLDTATLPTAFLLDGKLCNARGELLDSTESVKAKFDIVRCATPPGGYPTRTATCRSASAPQPSGSKHCSPGQTSSPSSRQPSGATIRSACNSRAKRPSPVRHTHSALASSASASGHPSSVPGKAGSVGRRDAALAAAASELGLHDLPLPDGRLGMHTPVSGHHSGPQRQPVRSRSFAPSSKAQELPKPQLPQQPRLVQPPATGRSANRHGQEQPPLSRKPARPDALLNGKHDRTSASLQSRSSRVPLGGLPNDVSAAIQRKAISGSSADRTAGVIDCKAMQARWDALG